MSYMHAVLAFGLVLLIRCECQAQIDVSYRVTATDYGPLIQISCIVNIPAGSRVQTVQWLFSDTTLIENTQLIDADPSRYTVSANGLRFSIRNALKEDEGYYTCRVSYTISSNTYYVNDSHAVAIASYLPPLNYPLCSIEPTTTGTIGSEFSFICQPGDSNPPVSLQLILERENGSPIELGTTNTTRTVTSEDNNAMFICRMTSDTFPTAQRNCSAGPIMVVPTTAPPTTTVRATTQTERQTPQLGPKSPMSTMATSTIPESTTSVSASRAKPTSSKQCSCITVLVAPVIIAIIAIIADVILLWKVFQLKSQMALSSKENTNDKQGVDGPYMELQKTQAAAAQSYTDLNFQNKDHDESEQLPEYEEVNGSRMQMSSNTANYVNVKTKT